MRASVVKALSASSTSAPSSPLREALADPDATIIQESAKALEELRFPHAFDPLARIYRESQVAQVRASAVRALAKIDTLEAAEMLLGIIQHDGTQERTAAVEALKRARGLRFVDLAREQIKQLAGPAKAAVRDVAPEPEHQPAAGVRSYPGPMLAAVSGATGFIGSAVVRKLLGQGRAVRALCEPGAPTRNLDALALSGAGAGGALERFPVDVCDL